MLALENQRGKRNDESSHVVEQELCFYSAPADGSQPFYVTDDPNLKGTRNYDHDQRTVRIQDARGCEDAFALSVHGFSLLQALPVPSVNFEISSEVNDIYVPFVQSTISSLFRDVREVLPFGVTIRRASAKGREEKPVRKVHVDQSETGAYLRARRELVSDPGLLQDILADRARYRIINMWKPINHAVQDHPLVFADSRTIADPDLVAVKQIYPHFTGETYAVRYGAAHKYWFWSDMQTNEAVLLQCFDNAGKMAESGIGRGARVAHASFCLARDGDVELGRESVEVRCIVVTSL